MSNGPDIRVLMNGKPVPLPTEVEIMIRALVERRDIVHKQGGGLVFLDYFDGTVHIKILRQTYSSTMKQLDKS